MVAYRAIRLGNQTAGFLRVRSEIAEQGVVAALLHRGVPAAEWIHGEHDEGPDEVDERQGESPSGRLSDRKGGEVGRLEHPLNVAVARVTEDAGEDVDERKVDQVVEHRHLADDERGAEEARGMGVDGPEKEKCGAECHEKKEQ